MTTHNGRRLNKIADRLDPIQVPDMKVETDPGPDEGLSTKTHPIEVPGIGVPRSGGQSSPNMYGQRL